MSVSTSRNMRPLFFAIAFLFVGCSSAYNTVRLKQTEGDQRFTLTTRHYLQTDRDHVAELDRGEREVQFDLIHVVPENGSANISLKVHLRLYQDDSAPNQLAILRDGKTDSPLRLGQFTFSDSAENVTVLDTGQRGETNPALVSEVQAQTGYITFGKPTAAGSVARRWRVYTATAEDAAVALTAAMDSHHFLIWFTLNGKPASAVFKPNQIEAWRRIFLKKADITE